MKRLNIILIIFLSTTISLIPSCKKDQPRNLNTTIWSGVTITFEKTDDSNPTEAINQDRITNNI